MPNRKTARPPAGPVIQKTASEMARASVLRNLQCRFERFSKNAKLHDLYLLDSILMDFDSMNNGPDSKAAESPLAEVFMLALDSDDTYVKIPREHIEAVEEFLEKIGEEPEDNAPASEPAGSPKLLVFPGRKPDQKAPHAS